MISERTGLLVVAALASSLTFQLEAQWPTDITRPRSSVGTERRDTYVLSKDKVFPHYAVGGGWETTFVLVNLSPGRTVRYGLIFFGRDGQPSLLTYRTVDGVGTTASSPGGSLKFLETVQYVLTDSSSDTKTGSVIVQYDSTDSRIGGHVIFRQRVRGRPDFEAAVPLSSGYEFHCVLPVDNRDGFSTALAMANGSGPNTIDLTFYDPAGVALPGTTLTMRSLEQTSFNVIDRLPATAGRYGTLLIAGSSNTGLSAFGLRFNPDGAFTSVPVLSWSGIFPANAFTPAP